MTALPNKSVARSTKRPLAIDSLSSPIPHRSAQDEARFSGMSDMAQDHRPFDSHRQPRYSNTHYPPLLPRDLLDDHDNREDTSVLHLAHFLKHTGPPKFATPTPIVPHKASSNQKKLVKRMLKISQQGQPIRRPFIKARNRSTARLRPPGVVQKVSRDGKKYMQILSPELVTQPTDDQRNMSPVSVPTPRSGTHLLEPAPAHENAGDSLQVPHRANSHQIRPASSRYSDAFTNEEIFAAADLTVERDNANQRDKVLSSVSKQNNTKQNFSTSSPRPSDVACPAHPSLQELQQMQRLSTPIHFAEGRNSAVTDARAALSSNPISDVSAPFKPLPSLPNGPIQPGRYEQKSANGNLGHVSADKHRARPTSTHFSDHSEFIPASNQGVRRVPHDWNPDLGTDRRPAEQKSLNSLEDLLSRASRHSRQSTLQSSSSEGDLFSKSNPSSSITTPSRPSTARPSFESRTSLQQERKERTRARKMRDLHRGRPSIDTVVEKTLVPTEQDKDGASLRKSTLERQLSKSRHVKLAPSCMDDVIGDSPTLASVPFRVSKIMVVADMAPLALRHGQPRQPLRKAANISLRGELIPCIQGLKLSTGNVHDSGPSRSGTDDTCDKTPDESYSPLSFKDRTPPDHRYRDASTVSGRDAMTRLSRIDCSAATPSTSRNANQSTATPVSGTSEARTPPNSTMPPTPSPSSRAPRLRPSHRTKDPADATTPTPTSTPQPPSARARPRTARLVERIDNLERDNRLLSAALMAVLKTSGKMNGCACGSKGRSAAHAAHAQRAAGHENGEQGVGGEDECAGVDEGRAKRQRYSAVSAASSNAGTSNSSSSGGGERGVSALEMYMATKLGVSAAAGLVR